MAQKVYFVLGYFKKKKIILGFFRPKKYIIRILESASKKV